jgi:hypothetical protein
MFHKLVFGANILQIYPCTAANIPVGHELKQQQLQLLAINKAELNSDILKLVFVVSIVVRLGGSIVLY